MRSVLPILRDFTYVTCMLTVALVFALAWQGPFVQSGSANVPNQAELQAAHR
jgi:hypothetical protein